MNELFNWILTFMLTISPVSDPAHQEVGRETQEQTMARYEEIAHDVIEVAFHPDVRPLFSEQDGGRTRTVTVLLGIMDHESNFYKDIDYGWKRGDSGRSWCMMQVWAGHAPKRTARWNVVHDRPPYWGDPESEISRGYSGPELISDRKLCLKEGLRIARWSFKKCGRRDYLEKLRVYASGSCSKGGVASREILRTSEFLWQNSKDKITWNDKDIVSSIENFEFNKYLAFERFILNSNDTQNFPLIFRSFYEEI